MVRCVICNLTWNSAKKNYKKVAFLTFPRDSVLRQQWINQCLSFNNNISSINVNNHRVCSLHFSNEDFERDMFHELTNRPVRLILKAGSVPTVNLINSSTNNLIDETSEDTETIEETISTKSADNSRILNDNSQVNINVEKDIILIDHNQVNIKSEEDIKLIDNNQVNVEEDICPSDVNPNENNLSDSNSVIKEKMQKQQILYKNLIEVRNFKINKYKSQIKSLQRQSKKLKIKLSKKHICSCTKYKEMAEKMFTSAQLKLLVHKKSAPRWSHEDISKALALRDISQPCYRYVRNILKYPLPSKATLNHYVSKMNMRQGLKKEDNMG